MADESDTSAIEHLKMIQAVVARVAGNSVQMKTWTVSLVTAVIVFTGLSDSPHWLIGAGGCIPVVVFWLMDARYLHLERCYIKLYETVAMGATISDFNLNYRPHATAVEPTWKVAFSWPVCTFYGSLLSVMITLLIYLLIGNPQNEATKSFL